MEIKSRTIWVTWLWHASLLWPNAYDFEFYNTPLQKTAMRITVDQDEEIERLLLIFGKGEVARAKATVRYFSKENIDKEIGQANFEQLPPPEKFPRRRKGFSEKHLDTSLQHPLPDDKANLSPQGPDDHYDIALSRRNPERCSVQIEWGHGLSRIKSIL